MNLLTAFFLQNIISPIILITLILGIMTVMCGGNPSMTLKAGLDFISKITLFIFQTLINFISLIGQISFNLLQVKYPSLSVILASEKPKGKKK